MFFFYKFHSFSFFFRKENEEQIQKKETKIVNFLFLVKEKFESMKNKNKK
jgi:hypothetical protein